jgi:hypothetical protein
LCPLADAGQWRARAFLSSGFTGGNTPHNALQCSAIYWRPKLALGLIRRHSGEPRFAVHGAPDTLGRDWHLDVFNAEGTSLISVIKDGSIWARGIA